MRGRRGPPGGRVQAGSGAARVPIPSVERRGWSPGRSSEGAPDACGTAETRGRPVDARRRASGCAGTPPERPRTPGRRAEDACGGLPWRGKRPAGVRRVIPRLFSVRAPGTGLGAREHAVERPCGLQERTAGARKRPVDAGMHALRTACKLGVVVFGFDLRQ